MSATSVTTLPTGGKLSPLLEAAAIDVPGLSEGRDELRELSRSLRIEHDVALDDAGFEGLCCDTMAAGWHRLKRAWAQDRSVVSAGIRDALLACSEWTGPTQHRNLLTISPEAMKEMRSNREIGSDVVVADERIPVPTEKLTFYEWGDDISKEDIRELDDRIELVGSKKGLSFTDPDGLAAVWRWKKRRTSAIEANARTLPPGWRSEAEAIVKSTRRNNLGVPRRDLLEQLQARRQEASHVRQWHATSAAIAALMAIPTGTKLREILAFEESAHRLIERGMVLLSAHRHEKEGEHVAKNASSQFVAAHFRPRRPRNKGNRNGTAG